MFWSNGIGKYKPTQRKDDRKKGGNNKNNKMIIIIIIVIVVIEQQKKSVKSVVKPAMKVIRVSRKNKKFQTDQTNGGHVCLKKRRLN